jgi:PHP family Zn ribbon phosphoesterase
MSGDRPGSGPGGDCVCPSCGARVKHTRGMPCYSKKCPKCGTRMTKG